MQTKDVIYKLRTKRGWSQETLAEENSRQESDDPAFPFSSAPEKFSPHNPFSFSNEKRDEINRPRVQPFPGPLPMIPL